MNIVTFTLLAKSPRFICQWTDMYTQTHMHRPNYCKHALFTHCLHSYLHRAIYHCKTSGGKHSGETGVLMSLSNMLLTTSTVLLATLIATVLTIARFLHWCTNMSTT